jgi:KUP system potassium uptake protein
VTSILIYQVARDRWKWAAGLALLMGASFLFIDLAFWAANLVKIPQGGWFPLLVGVVIFTLLTTWKKGRQILNERVFHRVLPRDMFLESITTRPPVKVPGTAVFMYNDPRGTPPALLHNLKHNKVLHEQVVFLSVRTAEVPYVTESERMSIEKIADGFHQVVLNYGFMEDAHVPRALGKIKSSQVSFKPMETTYFLGRETLIPSKRRRGMWLWREKLFSVMSRNARSAASFFRLPPNRVVELGAQVEL